MSVSEAAVRISGLVFAAHLVERGWVFWPTIIALGLLGAFSGLAEGIKGETK